MRLHPVSFAAAVGLIATTAAVLCSSPPAHSRHLPPAASRPASDRVTQTRPVTADFRGISLTTADDVVVRQGSPATISISGEAEEVARTETVVEKGRLVIRKTGKGKMSWGKGQGVVVTVTLPVVEDLSVSGSGNLEVEGALTGTALNVSVAGSGNVRLAADLTGALATSVAGSGNLKLTGRCTAHTLSVAGSGNIRADEMLATTTTVKISGSGNANVAAAETLEVSISGSGSVRYRGEPKQFVKRITGSGSVAKM